MVMSEAACGKVTITACGLLVTWNPAPAIDPLSGIRIDDLPPSVLTSGRLLRQA